LPRKVSGERGPARPGYDAAVSDPVRRRWEAGEVAFNAWSTFPGVASATILANAGFDAVTIDLQHGEHTAAGSGEVVESIEHAGAVPFVRLPWNDAASIMRALDLGARGLICPMVGTAEEARAFTRYCRYPPLGARSYGPVRAAFGTALDQTEQANAAVLAFAQIETSEGFANVEAICSTPGLDGVYVGPADLSLTLGFEGFADLGAAQMREALGRIVLAATSAGIVPGIHSPTAAQAIEMARAGFRFVGAAGDRELLGDAGTDALKRVRAEGRSRA
jgi:4-hydroxy-2-oxoheptanedioate aldolase